MRSPVFRASKGRVARLRLAVLAVLALGIQLLTVVCAILALLATAIAWRSLGASATMGSPSSSLGWLLIAVGTFAMAFACDAVARTLRAVHSRDRVHWSARSI